MDPMHRKLVPQPKRKPCMRTRCQILVAKEVLTSATVCRTTPIRRVVRVLILPVEMAIAGEAIRHCKATSYFFRLVFYFQRKANRNLIGLYSNSYRSHREIAPILATCRVCLGLRLPPLSSPL